MSVLAVWLECGHLVPEAERRRQGMLRYCFECRAWRNTIEEWKGEE